MKVEHVNTCPCSTLKTELSPCFVNNDQPDPQVCICFDLAYSAETGLSMFG